MKMDKRQEAQAAAAAGDSISSVGVSVKDYAPSEVFPEPLPGYKRSHSTPIKVAKIAAYTVIACTSILGVCMIISSYIQANASCTQFMQAEALLQQAEEIDRPSYQALVDPLQSDESSDSKQESMAAHREHHAAVTAPPTAPTPPSQPQPPINANADTQTIPIHIKLPLDFDDIAASLMEKNQRSRMNCVVEKKKAEEIMDHQPKIVRLPFGVNLTTDPRYEHVTGERMVIYCESGQDQRNLPAEQAQQPLQMLPFQMMMPSGPNQMANTQQMSQINSIPLSMITRAAQEEQAMNQQADDGPITIIAREEHVIPIFQQLLPEVRSMNQEPMEPRNMPMEARNLPMEARNIPMEARNMPMEARSMPEKILYHPAVPNARMLQALALGEPRMNQMAQEMRHMPMTSHHIPAIPSDMVRPPPPPAFHKIPIHVPTVLQQVDSQAQQVSDNGIEEEAEDSRPHFVQPRSVRNMPNAFDGRRF